MDKVCAVFGGSRGIGRAVAQLMAQKGYRLAIVARNLEVASAAAGDLGGDHLAFSCDVAEERDVQNTFEEMEKKLGRVNFLVNAAGINRDSLLVRTKTEDMISQLHTNLLGSMLTCKVALKTMIQQQRGSIVNVGSVIGLKGNSGQSVYSAGKGGLVGFSRALAKEVARKKIRVNVVAPGLGLLLPLTDPEQSHYCLLKSQGIVSSLLHLRTSSSPVSSQTLRRWHATSSSAHGQWSPSPLRTSPHVKRH
ncbi:3-oxoacyl-[acyl-carrier-protein] reductase isoform X1 [Ursus arctos]|uniref:3-oxoacyl-[acyl-carrier-protein] reductase isoform X1 n=1 Tax=Ursus arctos TaxID=9644 RepID=UPI001CF92E76|nr:3-oxoacyl-[acyl-carrier-protein] reductase isoform X1 [Ursus arctos]